MLKVGHRWFPEPRVLHPYPAHAFPTVIRDKNRMRFEHPPGSVRGHHVGGIPTAISLARLPLHSSVVKSG